MRRLDVIDTGPTPLGDAYGPPEELEAYVAGALERGEDVDPALIALVNEWHVNNGRPPLTAERAKTGQKPGGGGRPQFYGALGKYAKPGDPTASSTSSTTKTARPTRQPAVSESRQELSAELGAPIQRRMEFFAATVPNGPEALALKALRAGEKLTPAQRHLVALYNDDPWALGNLADSKLVGLELDDSPNLANRLEAAVDELKTNERYQQALAKYGPAPIVPVKALRKSSVLGQYRTDVIVMSQEGNIGRPIESQPMELDQHNVDVSLNGTLRHEYGHHIDSLLTSEQKARWNKVYDAWGYGSVDAGSLDPKDPDLDHGLSIYGRLNPEEGFAETFNLVTRRDFDRSQVRLAMRPMVEFIEELIDG